MQNEILMRLSIVIIAMLFFSFRAGDIDSYFTGDENFYFQSSKDMLASGDWLTPRYYGKPRFQKPILYYWLVAYSFERLGVNWYAARFPSVLFGALTVLLVYLIGQRLFKRTNLALLSAFILACTFKFFKYARSAIPDMVLLCFITLSFYIFIKLIEEDRFRTIRWVGFFIALALGTLTKGPIGIVIPVLSIAFFVLFCKEQPRVRKIDVALGASLFFVLTVPWLLVMLKLYGMNFFSEVWTREVVHRVSFYLGTKKGMAAFTEYLGGLFFYVPVLIVRFLPWVIFLPRGLYNSFRIARSDAWESKLHLLLLCWFFTVFILFTLLGEKHSQYMLALSPPFALIVGVNFSRGRWLDRRISNVPLVLLLIVAAVFWSFLANRSLRLNSAILSGFASGIYAYGPGEDDVIAVGSHELIPQQLEVYVDRPVEKAGGRWYDAEENERINKLKLENLFRQKERVFCVINKEDFEKYVSPELRINLRIIYADFLWKRKLKLTKESLALLFSGEIGPFLNTFKEEYYLITNR